MQKPKSTPQFSSIYIEFGNESGRRDEVVIPVLEVVCGSMPTEIGQGKKKLINYESVVTIATSQFLS